MPRRPARKQVPAPVLSEQVSDFLSPEEFWKLKKASMARATHRCDIEADAGATLATSHGTTPLRCVFFARGVCHRGPQCTYAHEVPDADFFAYARTQPQFDCFGRQRSGEDLTNRNDCTTLFVFLGGAFMASNGNNASAISEMIHDDFSVFGPISFINVIINKSIAFVRYLHRSSAEFAKEAMHRQCLKSDRTETVLSVRWANEDPNPTAKARVKREREERFVKSVGRDVLGLETADSSDESDESDDWRRYVSDEEEELDGGGGKDATDDASADNKDPDAEDDVSRDTGTGTDGGLERDGIDIAAKAGGNHPNGLFAAYDSE